MTNIRLKLLTLEEVGNIYEKSLEILSRKGIKVNHEKALELLDKAGAQVDFDNQQVRFPRDIVQSALKTVPSSLTLANRGERPDAVIPHPKGTFYVRNGSSSPYFVDPYTNKYHNMTIEIMRKAAQFWELLDGVDICALHAPQDAPEETADIHGLKAFLENTTKHINMHPFSVESIQYLIELGMVAGGGKEALKEKPVLSFTPNALNPLAIKDVDAEVILQASRYGMPLQVDSLPAGGATTPFTLAGNILQTSTEIMGTIVFIQLINPGNPVIAFPLPFVMDMSSGLSLQSSIEASLIQAATAQFIKDAYHVPVNAFAFSSDFAVPGMQSMIEITLKGMLVSTVGLDLISGVGMLASYNGFSPIQAIIDNMLIGIFRRINSGIEVNDDTLALEDILEVAPMTGSYLERAHTLKHCRDAICPELFVNVAGVTWEPEVHKDLYTLAIEKYREMEKKLKPLELPEDVQREINRIVKQADERLAK